MELNVKQYASVVVSFVLMIVIFAAVFVPVVSDLGGTTSAYNTIGDRATLVDDAANDDTTHTIVVTYATPSITIDGESITPDEGRSSMWYEVFSSDEIAINYEWKETNATISLTVYSQTSSQGIISVITNDLTLTVQNGHITYAYATYTLTRECTWFAYLDNEGDQRLALFYSGMAATDVYVNSIDQVRGMTISGNKVYSYVGLDVEVNKLNGTALGGDLTATCTLTPLSANDGISTFQVGRDVGDYTVTIGSVAAHPYAMLVPNEVAADSELDGSISALINVLPILVLVGIVIAAVGTFISRRD